MTWLAGLKWGAAVALLSAWSWFCYHQGGLAETAKVSTAKAKQEAGELKQDTKNATTIAQEASTYDQVLNTAPADPPHVSVCYYRTLAPATVPSAGAAQSGAAHAAVVPAALEPAALPTAGPDIGAGLEQLARQADAQVTGLQDYIAKVCRVP